MSYVTRILKENKIKIIHDVCLVFALKSMNKKGGIK